MVVKHYGDVYKMVPVPAILQINDEILSIEIIKGNFIEATYHYGEDSYFELANGDVVKRNYVIDNSNTNIYQESYITLNETNDMQTYYLATNYDSSKYCDIFLYNPMKNS